MPCPPPTSSPPSAPTPPASAPTRPPAGSRRPARPTGLPLLTPRVVWRVAFMSALMSAATFFDFFRALEAGLDVETARTLVVSTIVVFEIFYLFSVRYAHGPSLTWRGMLGTPAVLLGVGAVVLAQLAFTFWPPLQRVMESRPVSVEDGAMVIGLGVALLVVLEIEERLAHGLAGWKRSPASR